MTLIFDGKAVAQKRLEALVEEVEKLNKNGINPKLVTIYVGNDPASKLFLSLKKTAANEVGAELEIKNFDEQTTTHEIISLIQTLNSDKNVHGIMVQLPLPDKFGKDERDQILKTIAPDKDVDGMLEDSPYLTPVVKAILLALQEAIKLNLDNTPEKVAVVGAKGFVGSRVMRVLEEMEYDAVGLGRNTENWQQKIKEADVVISVTGEEKIINEGMIKKGVIVIDVGSPKPDVDKESVKGKAAFLSPVPGGVGPLTVVLLIENLIESARGGEKYGK